MQQEATLQVVKHCRNKHGIYVKELQYNAEASSFKLQALTAADMVHMCSCYALQLQ